MNVKLGELYSIYGQIDASYHTAATKVGLSDTELDIFYVICVKGEPCLQSAIYKMTGATRSTVNSAIKKMERDGIIHLEAGTGRNANITLTEKGKALSASTAEKIIAIENSVYDEWSKEEQEFFIRMNADFCTRIKKQFEERL